MKSLFGQFLEGEMEAIRDDLARNAWIVADSNWRLRLFDEMIRNREFTEFLTLPAIEKLAQYETGEFLDE